MKLHWYVLIPWGIVCAAMTLVTIVILRQRAAIEEAAAACPEANAIRKIRSDPSICWRDGDRGFVCYHKKLDIDDTPQQSHASASPL